ncbi:MAG TPA: NrfD/PsrC family molybdoenzyme membrane anchor subunit [Bacteroidia bacterium]|nr:NrfD/PsrC family molybdoenzyme membrane anchor subunit [Bacteroidia bacterium]
MEKLKTESGNGETEIQNNISENGQKEKYKLMEKELMLYNEKQKIETEKRQMEKYRLMEEELLHPIQKIGLAGKVWIGFLVVICLAGLYAYYIQETKSKYETISLRDYTMWGVYISTFVFYVALSLIGALMSATLKLIKFEWYRPLSRIAEIIAVASIMLAGVCIVAAMGRPERLYYLFIYGRIQSPIVWDVIVILTYITASFLLLFIPLLPGIAICRDRLTNKPAWQKLMYRKLSFGWKGSPEQWKIVKKSLKILAILVIPLGVSIHTVTAWLFASTLRPEWDSTNFGPYFVSGAFSLGAAAMIVAVYVLRKAYKLEKYLTDKHFDFLGKMLVFLSLCYLYFNINEYLVPSYKMSTMHANHLLDLFSGETAPTYWLVILFGIAIPAVLPMLPVMRTPLPLTIIAGFAVIAAWFKRYLIVIPGLSHPFLPIQDVPQSWMHYSPSIVEMTIVVATFAALLLIITVFSRLFPIISIWEVAEGDGFNILKINKPVKKEQV